MSQDHGRVAEATGLGSPEGPQPDKPSAPDGAIPRAVWLIWASEGEYSDRSEWPVVAVPDEASAERLTVRLEELWRTLDALWRAKEDEDEYWDRAKFDAFWETQAEAVEYTRLTGEKGSTLGGCYTDERSFTCCEIRVLSASAIEARSDETRSGSAEGESAMPKADAQGGVQ